MGWGRGYTWHAFLWSQAVQTHICSTSCGLDLALKWSRCSSKCSGPRQFLRHSSRNKWSCTIYPRSCSFWQCSLHQSYMVYRALAPHLPDLCCTEPAGPSPRSYRRSWYSRWRRASNHKQAASPPTCRKRRGRCSLGASLCRSCYRIAIARVRLRLIASCVAHCWRKACFRARLSFRYGTLLAEADHRQTIDYRLWRSHRRSSR